MPEDFFFVLVLDAEPVEARSSLILVMSTGGFGGFFASVRDIGATGQQQHARSVSAEEEVRGGAGGFWGSRGGGTNPGSFVPSSARRTVPVQSVAASAEETILFADSFFMTMTCGLVGSANSTLLTGAPPP